MAELYGAEPLLDKMSSKIYDDAIWCHQATMS